ncbi:hypothetical protein ACMFMG_011335 [Clarireedia jacksonii]
MHFSTITSFVLATAAAVSAQQFMVPTPWYVQDISIGNVRHGTGGFWSLKIIDTPTPAPQGLNVTCYYYSGYTYIYALDGAPINEPCNDPNVTFGLFPDGDHFTLNITHLYGDCGSAGNPKPCKDNGTWRFSWDDVRGQESDVQNNFGQSGGFSRAEIDMYPTRDVPSQKCEFC